MKIALLGYGKMGEELNRLAVKRGHEIVAIYNNLEDWEGDAARLPEAEIAFEFSTPDSVVENIYHCFDHNIPVVAGTTGWLDEMDEVIRQCKERNQTLLFSPNFSIGANLFFELNKFLAKLMSKWENYDISIEETHHVHKLDSPSGTAIVLANDIIRNSDRKDKWVKDLSENPDELGIKSYRTENVTGTHVVRYESDVDMIEIIHTAKSRKGLALGAMLCGEWLIGKKGFYEMKDFLAEKKNIL
ncbi:MAG TPA: 4-hydroxy-tetrahydrodipicolinate reductase [Bacteroidales bacterium]|nr:4-hydroxy-tetrahydrodipicolinate reductase [Bacteroidales bacterium]HPS73398.1 4-hydroxy-tetrahydrodipicolinate reductase [Bacteroidales bacterium]